MSKRLSFCLEAIKTLQDGDLDALTTGIEGYARSGVAMGTAETMAVADLLSNLAAESKSMMGLLRAQHPELFAAPTQVAAPAVEAAAEEPAQPSKRQTALSRLSNILGPPTAGEPEAPYGGPAPAPKLTAEQEQQLLPVLAELLDAAVIDGAKSFQAAASRALADIEAAIGKYAADALTLKHLQGAYISMSSRYADGVVDDMMTVAQFKSKDQLKETPDVPNRQPRVEPDRPDGAAPGVAAPDGNGQRGAEPGDGQARPGPASTGSGNAGGTRVRGSRAPASGARSDPGLFGDEPAIPPGATGREDGQRGDPGGDQGAQPHGVSDEDVETAARDHAADVRERTRLQREAERTPVITGDAENIAATLPILLPLQQTDVLFAEARFAQPDGHGVLFTNGTGTGKTFVALGVIKRQVKQGKGNILVVAPNDEVINGWIAAAPKLGLTLTKLENTKDAGRGVVITTYANLRDNNALLNRKWDMLASDEAQNLNQNQDGDPTESARRFRVLTMHPDSARARTEMRYPDLHAEIVQLEQQAKAAEKAKDRAKWQVLQAKLTPLYNQFRQHLEVSRAEVEAAQDNRPKALFLSATPFAYEKSIKWGQGYLFDWNKNFIPSDGYNAGDAYQAFMMQHFGYRMRFNKLTEPDGRKVDRGLMQRNFNTWLKNSGALAGRMLEVDQDYDRRFIAAQSGLGRRIDQAFQWFYDTKAEDLGDLPVKAEIDTPDGKLLAIRAAMSNVRMGLRNRFDYHSRMRLLEALKAEAAVPYIQGQLDMGRKVVVFHDLIKGQKLDPFGLVFDREKQPTAAAVFDKWAAEFSDLVNFDWASLRSPIETMHAAFGDKVAELNGQNVTKKQRKASLEGFNSDEAGGPTVLVVQSALEAGWSGHDTTGKHPRVLLNLGLPVTPTRSIQQEGRIYRVGQASNAMFRYMNTQTNWEFEAFANTISRRASTAENLAMGEEARGLLASYVESFEETGDYPAGHEGEGTGGKQRDRELRTIISDWDRAKTMYWAQQKKTQATKANEGKDYFATPEPLGLKMVQWGDIRPEESGLEPSAGHGAIARWFPDNTSRIAVEPSPYLAPRLALVFDGSLRQHSFEDLHITNKADVIAMNPPFGVGGKTAIEHLDKAFNDHLNEGGRIVALLPEGPAADARLDKFLNGTHSAPAKPLGHTERTGDFYAGDSVTLDGREGVYRIERRNEDGFLMLRRTDGNGGIPEGFRSHYLASLVKAGPRTAAEPNAPGAHVVGTIRLPPSTFVQAGTAVRTRIIIIDKLDKDQTGPGRVDYDFSQVESVEALFDEIESLAMPERTKPRPVETDDDAPVDAKPDDDGTSDIPKDPVVRAKPQDGRDERTQQGEEIAQALNLPVVEHTTGKGNLLRGVVLKHVNLNQAKTAEGDPYAFPKNGGVFVRLYELDKVLKAHPLPSVAQEERAVYAVREPDANYDLFGERPVPSAARGPAPGAQRRQSAAARDQHLEPTAVLSVRAEPSMPGLYRVTSQIVEIGRKSLPVARVANWSDAAAALSSLTSSAVERFDVLITDKAGKPLALVGGFKGEKSGVTTPTSTVLAEALRIEGAAAAWGVHNHPSGIDTLSSGDMGISQLFGRAFGPSSVQWMGLAAVADNGSDVRFSAITHDGQHLSGIVYPSKATSTVPIVERTLDVSNRRTKAIGGYADAKAEAAAMMKADPRPGIIFLDFQNRPQAWVPVDPAEMAALRADGRFDRLINSASNAGASNAIIANPGGALNQRTLSNIASALHLADVKTLDVIDTVKGRSAAENGLLPSIAVPVLSRAGEEAAVTVRAAELRKAITHATTLWSNAPGMPHAMVVKTAEDLPEDVKEMLRARRAMNNTRGLLLPDGRVFLVADRIANVDDGLKVLFHEVYGHYGMRAFLGDSYETQMGLLRMANPALAAEANAWYAENGQQEIQALVNNAVDPEVAGRVVRALAVEEALADRADDTPIKGWKSLMARLQKALRSMGMDSVANWLEAMTEAETQALLDAARRVVLGDDVRINLMSPDVAGATSRGPALDRRTVAQGRIRRTVDELVAMAEEQSSWKDWYDRHKDTVNALFQSDGVMFQKILSATSQLQTVKGNVTMALRAYEQMITGRPFVGYLPAVANNLERIRTDQALNGPKISEFERGNLGADDAMAVDRHIAQLLFNTSTPSRRQIESAKQRIRVVADRLGWTYKQAQAALWAANQVRKGTDPTQVVSYDRVLETRADIIREVRARYGRGDGVPAGRAADARADEAGQARPGAAGVVLSRVPNRATVEVDGRSFTMAPPPAAGMVRWYHGGSPETVTGPLWFTSDLRDANGWASRSESMQVWYVDVQEGAAGVDWGDMANGIIMRTRQELPAALAARRLPLLTPVTRPTPALKPSTGIIDTAIRLPMTPIAMVSGGAYTKTIELADRALSVFGDSYEYVKAGVVDQYGLDTEHNEAKQAMKTAIRVNARKTGEVVDRLRALDRAQSRVAYLWMSDKTEDAAAARALFDQLPEEPRLVLQSLKADIEHLSDEAVELGLISPEVRERNRMAYLHRSYERYESENTTEKQTRMRAVRILGDQFKGRGMSDYAGMDQVGTKDFWQRKTNGSAHDPSLKGKRFIRFERRELPDTNTPQLFEDENGAPMGRIREVAYWPEDEPVPARFNDWRNDGPWEARYFNKTGKVGMWRDFTLAERTKLGEVQEVKFAVATTMMQMVRDVETARFLDWVARNESVLDESLIPEGAKLVEASTWLTRSYLKKEWVQVPDTKIPGTAVKRYGNLAGRFVPGPVWNDIRQIAELTDQGDLSHAFAEALKMWKISKTALSPVTHMNNVMSNFMLADLHDVQARHIYVALRAWTTHKKDPAYAKLIGDYQDNGGDAGKFNDAEIREELFAPLLEELRKQIEAEAGVKANITAAQVIDLLQHRQFRQAFAALGDTRVARGAAWIPKKMIKLYGVEDEVFRLAAFIKARQDGLNDHDAGKFARDSFLNYDITAPWINAMRRTAWPFLAFSYRAIPMLARTMADKPHKLVKYALLSAGLNALAYAMLGGDDDDREERERALMADEKAGKIWGFLTPKLIRMPYNDKNGNPVFLDIRRWIPGGDVVDLGQSQSMIPLPPPLVPGGPLMLFAEFALNSSGFTGQDIVMKTDDWDERLGKSADWLWKGIAPNNPVVPGTYSFEGLMNAANGRVAPGPSGQEKTSLGHAALSSVGVKLDSYPIESLDYLQQRKTSAEVGEIKRRLSLDMGAIDRSGMSDEDKQAEVATKLERARSKIGERSKALSEKREKAGLQ